MKNILYLLIILVLPVSLSSCKNFLERTPDVIPEDEIFGTYLSFQGFFDPNYSEVIDYANHCPFSTMNYGGDTYSYNASSSGQLGNNGDYWAISGDPENRTSLYRNTSYGYGDNVTSGIWLGGWRGIRVCNISLAKLKLLKTATDEEKKLIEGQAYFFRAFFHGEILAAYGGMPFVDKVFEYSDNLDLPRLSYQACTDKIVEDYDKAIALLPDDWDNTALGAANPGANTGRATKGAALAYKQKHLLYAGSPLMNKYSGYNYTYNADYCKKAAEAGWECIKLANDGIYSLVPFANYSDNFTKRDGSIPWTSETIFQKITNRFGQDVFSTYLSRTYAGPYRVSGSRNAESVNQKFIDKFEMADGTRYNVAYDKIDSLRWEKRDPRFRKNIIIDREQHGNSSKMVINLYDSVYNNEGSDKTVAAQVALPYLIKKFWPKGVNIYDSLWNDFQYVTPNMRLAEVYLDYAEAVAAVYGPNGSAPGATLTALDAINIVRARAGMPPVTATAAGYSNFMDLVRNERNVELCFEGHYWFDIRRWHIAHLPENMSIVDLRFDKAWTPSTFERKEIMTRVFEDPKHYWLPIPREMTLLYEGMYQNPGWD